MIRGKEREREREEREGKEREMLVKPALVDYMFLYMHLTNLYYTLVWITSVFNI